MRHLLPLCLALVVVGCASLEKRVDLTYGTVVTSSGGSGEVFIAQPVMKQTLTALPSGKQIIGRVGEADIVVRGSPENWVLSALIQELSAAGYQVKTVPTLPNNVSKGMAATILALAANQSSNLLTLTTVTDLRMEVQLWRAGRLIKTLTASAQDHEEGTDRSSEPIRSALEKTLQRIMQELLPDIVTALEQR
jgi:hypothetical protein